MSSSPARPSSPVLTSDPVLSTPPAEAEPEEGDELQDFMRQDYKAIPELDQYDSDILDQGDYDNMDAAARQEVERRLRKRDLEDLKRSGRGGPSVLTPISESEDERPRRRRRIEGEDDEDDDMSVGFTTEQSEGEGDAFINLNDFKGPLAEYLAMDAPRREVRRRFKVFLAEFTDQEKSTRPYYPPIIHNMCTNNNQSLQVSYLHLSRSVPMLAIWIADAPDVMFELFDQEAMAVVLTLYPRYHEIHSEVHVRITDLPIADTLRSLRQIHLNALIKVEGVVTRRTSVFPQLQLVKFDCFKCGATLGPYVQGPTGELSPGRCAHCQATGPFTVNLQQTVFRNYQKVTLQESPGSVPAGRIPRQKDVVLLHDLIDTISPGEEVEITGVYKHTYDNTLNVLHGFPVFSTIIQANYVEKKVDAFASTNLVEEDIAKIIKLSKNSNVSDIIINSIGPSIYGHETVKTAMAMALFGGVAKEYESHRIRGDINVLLLGDPGTAKSQFLKYIEKTAHRSVYTTGKGASAVGLTASVRNDPLTREWTLEGGALVLADNGICLIDEFDKMSDQDRTSIHEAMEQQSISISKAGIICTLKARCAVIAAANPVSGRYNSTATFMDNVDLTEAILSRFDILCVIRDTVDRDVDAKLAAFVCDSHIQSHPQYDEEKDGPVDTFTDVDSDMKIDQDLLKKYIMYARSKCNPKITQVNSEKIGALYAELRRESSQTDGIPIAVRHMESMIRMAESHAKMHLRDHVTEEDVNMAMRVMLECFIKTQKYAVRQSLTKHFQRYIRYRKDNQELLLHLLKNLVTEGLQLRRLKSRERHGIDEQLEQESEEDLAVSLEDFTARARQLDITRLDEFFDSDLFARNRYIVNRESRQIIKTF